MNEAISIFQNSVFIVGITGLIAIFAICLCVFLHKTFGGVMRDTKFPFLIMAPMFLIALHNAYSKAVNAKDYVFWDSGIYDDGTILDTNDWHTINFKWKYDEWVIPTSVVSIRAFEIDGTPTNQIPIESGQIIATDIPIYARQTAVYMEREFTNYLYYVEHSYIPDAPVVTNGVYHIQCVGGKDVWVPIGLTIKNDSHIISPHKEKQ